ncbi:hypothetical protein HDV01_004241 [Terramyces sp. JEL0728]|nr:hypothetical protein HDV01_004241 [Terramyces sp. JEL0728]
MSQDNNPHSILKKSHSQSFKSHSGVLLADEAQEGEAPGITQSTNSINQEVSVEIEPPKRRRSKVNFMEDSNQSIDEKRTSVVSASESLPQIVINTPERKGRESSSRLPSLVIPFPIQEEEKEPKSADVNAEGSYPILVVPHKKTADSLQVPSANTTSIGKQETSDGKIHQGDISPLPRKSYLSAINPFFLGPASNSDYDTSPKPHSVFDPHIKRSVEMLNDSGAKVTDQRFDDKKSESSNGSSLNSKYPTAREINESFGKKVWRLKLTLLSVVYCVGLAYVFVWLSIGLRIPIEQVVTQSAFSVIIEVALLAANYLVASSLNEAISAYFGYCLTRKTGYSLAVCGYTQAKISHKHKFAKELSQNSACRQTLIRLRWFWLVLELLTIVTPIVSVSISAEVLYTDDVYTQYGYPEDRTFPNFDYATGVASHIFGQALGVMRAEEMQLGSSDSTYSTFIMGPQLLDAAADGQSIVGQGYTLQIFSDCYCININDPEDMNYLGINQSDFTYFQTSYSNTNPLKGLISKITQLNSTTINIKSALTGFDNVCGGNQYLNVAPVCSTTVNNFNFAVVQVQMMTDGTPSSVAAKYVTTRYLLGPANTTWASYAFESVLGGTRSINLLPQQSNGLTNPLLKWTTQDLMTPSVVLLGSGMEVLYSIVLRSGIQRTFSGIGTSCIRNSVIHNEAFLQITQLGLILGLISCTLLFLISIYAIYLFIPSIRCPWPVENGIRLTYDKLYFTTMVNSASLMENADDMCNSKDYIIWQDLDKTYRIGEDLATYEDMIGRIVIAKPKLVHFLRNGRMFQ